MQNTLQRFTLHDGAVLAYRRFGSGKPLVLLHSGWGQALYPFDSQIALLAPHYHLLIADRRGYGQSTHVDSLALDFHQHAANDMLEWLDGIGIGNAILWGHSDGAVIAALIALTQPERVRALILEAVHYRRAKPLSLEFFKRGQAAPESFGGRVTAIMATEHGDPYWRSVIQSNANIWLAIHKQGGDLYDGRLSQISVPALIIQGADDDHTAPEEVEAMTRQILGAQLEIYEGSGHSPHSESASRDRVNSRVETFLATLAPT